MRRAKIVCTLGPATASEERIRQLVDAGMDVARLNLSHGDHSDHEQTFRRIRQASDDSGRAIGVLADLQGPKIRLGRFTGGSVTVTEDAAFTITTRDVPGDQSICSTTYAGLPGDVRPGDEVLLDDGAVRLRVREVDATDVHTVVEIPGVLSNNKGINLPGVDVSVPGDVGEGRRRPALGAVDAGRPHRAVVRAAGQRRGARAQGDERGRRAAAV